MDSNECTFAWISVALALVIVLLARASRVVLVLVISSVLGAVFGVVTLTTSSMQRICDFEKVKVDTCSGTYIAIHGAHRLPQFMQGHSSDAWLVAAGAFLGLVVADLLALVAIWAGRRVRRPQPAVEAAS